MSNTIITILIIIPATPFPTFRTSEFLNQHMLDLLGTAPLFVDLMDSRGMDDRKPFVINPM